MPGLTDGGRRVGGVMLGLGLCAAVTLLAVGLFQKFAERPEPPPAPVARAASAPVRAPARDAAPGRTVEVAPGTATNGHFTIRLLGGTSAP